MRDLVQFSTYMFDESHFHEILQNKLCCYILDVHKKSSSLAVKGELGVYPISINIYINIMKFFYHLGDLSKKGNYLISNCLYECYKDLYSADSSVNKNWLKAVIYLSESNGSQLSNLTDYLELDQQKVLKNVKQNLCKIYEEYFFQAVKDSNRLSPMYNKIKSAYKEEEYLSEITYHKYRSAITKFRISAHFFPIEYGRWTKIEHNNRICQICFMGGLGNEFHYFSKCQNPSIVKVRKEFNDLTQITDKNTITDKIFKIDDKNSQYVGKFLHMIA